MFQYKYYIEYLYKKERIRITLDDEAAFRARLIRILWDSDCELISVDVNKQLKEVDT